VTAIQRRLQRGLVFGTSPQTFIDVLGADRSYVWEAMGYGPRSMLAMSMDDRAELADRLQVCVSDGRLTEGERFHIWAAMDLLSTINVCDALGGTTYHLTQRQRERLGGGIPAGDEAAVDHMHRCARLCGYLRPDWAGGWPGIQARDVDVRDTFQPWFCREAEALDDLHRRCLPRRETHTDNPHMPLATWGFRGIAWCLSIYVETAEPAGEDLADMMQLMARLCNRGWDYYDLAWRRVVGSACDVWSQRTGIELCEQVGVQVIRTGAAERFGWQRPRLHISSLELRTWKARRVAAQRDAETGHPIPGGAS
jgi:hypothetical protein